MFWKTWFFFNLKIVNDDEWAHNTTTATAAAAAAAAAATATATATANATVFLK